MSKLYDIYKEKKEQNSNKLYLFKNGNFYLALSEDFKIMHKELGLKITAFSREAEKCGFPISEYDKYIKFIKLLGYQCEVILNDVDQIIEDIKDIDINHLNVKTAIDKINFYQKILLNQ